MNITSRAGNTASAALLTFLLGSAASFATEISERQIVLAYVGGDTFRPYMRYSRASSYYDDEKPRPFMELLVRSSGALTVGIERVGSDDEKVAAKALLGRALLSHGDRERARGVLDAALAAASAAGWDDRRANGILRDLAWIAGANDDTASASLYAGRVEICPLPCAEDALPLFQEEASRARSAVNEALGFELAATRIDLLEGADLITFVEATYGPQSAEAADAWGWRAISLRQSRPWEALDYYQRSLDVEIAIEAGVATTLDTRNAMAALLLQAGEYRRLADFAAALLPEALEAARTVPDVLYLPDFAMNAARLRARALWHLRDPEARPAYGVAIDTMFEFRDSDMARTLLEDLLDARYDAEIVRIADALLRAYPGDADALFAKARVAAWAGRYDEAAALVAQITEQTPVTRFQHAFYLEKAGKTEAAEAIRAGIVAEAAEEEFSWSEWSELAVLMGPRDAGAYEGAAELAGAYLDRASEMIAAGSYSDAQRLWQIAYTLALGGETRESFRLMKEAASIAARLSFADANDTDGGSLQLLRRDKFRYLLFVDIAWAAATGEPPDSMSVSSRY